MSYGIKFNIDTTLLNIIDKTSFTFSFYEKKPILKTGMICEQCFLYYYYSIYVPD